jgi:hypothetical protein
MAGGPVRQPVAGVDFIPQSEIYEFGYWTRSRTFLYAVSLSFTNPLHKCEA